MSCNLYTHFQHVITNVLELMYVNLRSETFHTYPQPQQGAYYQRAGGEGEATVVKSLALNKITRGPDSP